MSTFITYYLLSTIYVFYKLKMKPAVKSQEELDKVIEEFKTNHKLAFLLGLILAIPLAIPLTMANALQKKI